MTEVDMTNPLFKRLVRVLLLCSLMTVLGEVQADSDSLTVNISGTIVASSCSVNNGQTVSVEFGDVQVDQVYSATAQVPVSITCDSPPAGTVKMKIVGTPSSFDNQALTTDVPGLGITLSNVSATAYGALDLNTFYDVKQVFGLSSNTGSFNITAGLTTKPGVKLPGGEFNASATLVLQMS